MAFWPAFSISKITSVPTSPLHLSHRRHTTYLHVSPDDEPFALGIAELEQFVSDGFHGCFFFFWQFFFKRTEILNFSLYASSRIHEHRRTCASPTPRGTPSRGCRRRCVDTADWYRHRLTRARVTGARKAPKRPSQGHVQTSGVGGFLSRALENAVRTDDQQVSARLRSRFFPFIRQ